MQQLVGRDVLRWDIAASSATKYCAEPTVALILSRTERASETERERESGQLYPKDRTEARHEKGSELRRSVLSSTKIEHGSVKGASREKRQSPTQRPVARSHGDGSGLWILWNVLRGVPSGSLCASSAVRQSKIDSFVSDLAPHPVSSQRGQGARRHSWGAPYR